MKNTQTIAKLNIENLTSLWATASEFNHSFIANPQFSYSVIEASNWPNRLWFNNDLDLEMVLNAKDQVLSKHPNLIVPYWGIYENHSYQLLEKNGFTKLFEQVGMSLKIADSFDGLCNINLEPIVTLDQANNWCSLFEMSFGYRILPDILLTTNETIGYFTVYYQNKAVGTAITYQTGNVMGVHAIGIIPEARRKGLAHQLMIILLNLSIKQGCEYVTLQASNMGKGLYLKLGFEEQFTIKNYSLKQYRE